MGNSGTALRRAIKAAIMAGELPAVRVGAHLVVAPTDLARWLAAR